MYEKYRSLGFFDRGDIVFPRAWERGEVPSPTGMKKKIEDWGEYKNKPIEWADKTESKRLQKTEESISEGDAWSGVLTRREKGKKRYYTNRSAGEGEAYYLTNKEILEPVYQQRLKEFGMFLDDYGVPMKDVEEILGVVGWQKPGGETKPQQVRMPQKKQGRMLSK
jgi:hypothetical protein